MRDIPAILRRDVWIAAYAAKFALSGDGYRSIEHAEEAVRQLENRITQNDPAPPLYLLLGHLPSAPGGP